MKGKSIKDFLGRTSEETAEGLPPEAPQENLGAYTVQAGDTLESIALQVYGDSSLWYLIADANGISNKNAHASGIDQLRVGQRINLPAVATGQHHTNKTHKVLNANQMIGNISATTPLPPTPPPIPEPRKHHGIFSRIVVAVVAVVATVLTAGIIGALAGVANAASLTSLFNIGANVLAGGGMASLTGSMAAGFTAGFT
ncbi:LysM peptidoglycan-binding domain-containing protein, partial [Legionella shakespearei]